MLTDRLLFILGKAGFYRLFSERLWCAYTFIRSVYSSWRLKSEHRVVRERACPFPCLNGEEKEPVVTTCPPSLTWATGFAGTSRWGDAVVPSTAVYDRGQLFEIVQAVALFCVEGSGRFPLRCLVKIGLNCRLILAILW